MKKNTFFYFNFLCKLILVLFIGFDYFSPNFGVLLNFWEIPKIKMEDPRWPTFVAVITSVADLKGNLSVRNIYPPSLIVIASIVAKLWRGGGGGGPHPAGPKMKKKLSR